MDGCPSIENREKINASRRHADSRALSMGRLAECRCPVGRPQRCPLGAADPRPPRARARLHLLLEHRDRRHSTRVRSAVGASSAARLHPEESHASRRLRGARATGRRMADITTGPTRRACGRHGRPEVSGSPGRCGRRPQTPFNGAADERRAGFWPAAHRERRASIVSSRGLVQRRTDHTHVAVTGPDRPTGRRTDHQVSASQETE